MSCKKICIMTIIVLIFVSACQPDLNVSIMEPTPTNEETAATETTRISNYTIVREFFFDNEADLNYFDFLGTINGEQNTEIEVTKDDAKLENGNLFLGEYPIRGLNSSGFFNFNSAIHFRWIMNTKDTCANFFVSPTHEYLQSNTENYVVEIDACSYSSLSVLAHNPKTGPVDIPGLNSGTLIIENDIWIDTVVWLSSTPQPTINIISWQTNTPDVYSINRYVINRFYHYPQIIFSLEAGIGDIAIDFIKIINNDIDNYLWDNASVYQNKEEIISEILSDDYLNQHTNFIVAQNTSTQEPTKSVAANTMIDTDFSESIFTNMLQYEDLPEEYRMYQISNKMVDTLDELRFEKTFLQGPTSSGGGLWITSEVTIHKEPIESKVALMDTIGLNIRYENLRAEYPEVGEHALSFYRSPFERYLTSRGNITIDFYCNSLFTGSHPYCNPESLAELAQTIYDRLPVNIEKPSGIEFSFVENSNQQYFDFIDLQCNEQGCQIQWNAKEYLPLMDIALYHEDLEEFTYVEKLVNPQIPQIGEGSAGLKYGQVSDNSGILPGNYIVYVVVDGNLAAQFPFKVENIQ